MMRVELAASRETLGDSHPDTLTSINDLAVLLGDKGDLAASEPLYREALEAQRSTLGANHPNTTLTMNNLASLLRAKDNLAEAVTLFGEALEAQRETLGNRHSVRHSPAVGPSHPAFPSHLRIPHAAAETTTHRQPIAPPLPPSPCPRGAWCDLLVISWCLVGSPLPLPSCCLV